MSAPYVYLNGRIVPLADAAISPYDIGLLRGYAVFDLLRTVGGRPFLLGEHLRRLRRSAELLGLTVPETDERIGAIIDELLVRNAHPEEATVRLVLTGGVSPDGMEFDPATPTFLILTHDLHEPPDSVYEDGVGLVLHEHRREVPEAKTTNYLTMLRYRESTAEAGAIDLLYHDGGRVFEAASASVYFVRDGRILAPGDSVLWGTVGSLVLEMMGKDYEIVSGDVTIEQALGAQEAFLTSTTRGVIPIVRLGEHQVGDGRPGPVTRDAQARWDEAIGKR